MTEKIVEHIALKKKNFKGEETEVTIKDLLKYKNLKSCNLFHFYITKEDINILNQLPFLQMVKFDMCYFNMETLQLNETIQDICFNLCENLKIKHLKNTKAGEITIIQLKEANIELNLAELEYAENLKELAIHHCKVKGLENILEKAPNLKRLNLDGSIVEDKSILFELKNKIRITNEEEFYLANA